MKNVTAYSFLQAVDGDLLSSSRELTTHYSYTEMANKVMDDLLTFVEDNPESNQAAYVRSWLETHLKEWNNRFIMNMMETSSTKQANAETIEQTKYKLVITQYEKTLAGIAASFKLYKYVKPSVVTLVDEYPQSTKDIRWLEDDEELSKVILETLATFDIPVDGVEVSVLSLMKPFKDSLIALGFTIAADEGLPF